MSTQENLDKIKELLKGTNTAMLTTFMDDLGLHTRPMAYQELDRDGCMWFFTNEFSPKVSEISRENKVGISFSNEVDNNYLVLYGKAFLSRDKEKIGELFNPMIKAWFPKGLEDPDLALLQVKIESAEYWDSSSSKMVFLFNLAKSLVTGKTYDDGEHGKIML